MKPVGLRRVRWLSWRSIAVLSAVVVLLSAVVNTGLSEPARAQGEPPTAHDVNDALGLGINLGNALEGPREGDWGMVIQAEYFELIAEAGFKHVRVPIRFSAYAATSAPYTITSGVDPTVTAANNLWQRLDWVIAQAEANDLYVILDLHLYDEIHDDVDGHRDRFLAIWDQVATRYATAGPHVLFELLNEPRGEFNDNPGLLNELLADALDVVRDTNPDRTVLVGPARWNAISALSALELPDDPNLIVTVHFYDPFDFTHQGAEWLDPPPPAPIAWDPDGVGLGINWQDWSWDSDVVVAGNGLRTTFRRQYAGLQFGLPRTFDPVLMGVHIAGDAQLQVSCDRVTGNGIAIDTIELEPQGTTHIIDLTTCPANSNRVAFMLTDASAATITMERIVVCMANGRCLRPIESGADAVESRILDAVEWGEANDRPIHVGEYGAYSANGRSSLSDRAAWTKLVTDLIRDNGLSASYWEFGAGFGAYDRSTGEWVQPLLDALDPAAAGPEQPLPPVGPQPVAIGGIAGTITDAETLQPIFGAQVCAQRSVPRAELCAFTDLDGDYEITGVTAGDWAVEISDPTRRYQTRCAGSITCDPPGLIRVSSPGETVAIDGRLPPAESGAIATAVPVVPDRAPWDNARAVITGQVTRRGAPIAAVSVCATGSWLGTERCAVTDADGTYRITGLPTDNYVVEFNGGETCYSFGCVNPTPVGVVSGRQRDGINAELD